MDHPAFSIIPICAILQATRWVGWGEGVEDIISLPILPTVLQSLAHVAAVRPTPLFTEFVKPDRKGQDRTWK